MISVVISTTESATSLVMVSVDLSAVLVASSASVFTLWMTIVPVSLDSYLEALIFCAKILPPKPAKPEMRIQTINSSAIPPFDIPPDFFSFF